MKKIPSLFVMEDYKITERVTPGCEWVLDGEGTPKIKWDGTACMIKNDVLYKRYDNSKLKNSERIQKTKPLDTWIHCGDESERGKYIYWVPISEKDYYHQIAWAYVRGQKDIMNEIADIFEEYKDGTYELVGPNIQGNPHDFEYNHLIRHGVPKNGHSFSDEHELYYLYDPRSYDDLKAFLREWPYEGIVWHHDDGRMCKITRAKFGYSWPITD